MQLPAKQTRAAAQFAMQFPAEKIQGCSTGLLSVAWPPNFSVEINLLSVRSQMTYCP